ncbi:acyltransferase [Mycobacterium sp. C31M]
MDRATWLVNGSNIELGDHVKVSTFSALIAGYDASIKIGHYTILGPGVFVVAANHGIADRHIPIRYQPWKEQSVVIGDDVWVGANAVILPGATIGTGSVIGAGAVVTGNIPPGSIVHQDNQTLVVRRRP